MTLFWREHLAIQHAQENVFYLIKSKITFLTFRTQRKVTMKFRKYWTNGNISVLVPLDEM